jgi:hypothetical protein
MYSVQYERPGGNWPLELEDGAPKGAKKTPKGAVRRECAQKWLESRLSLQRSRAAIAAGALKGLAVPPEE